MKYIKKLINVLNTLKIDSVSSIPSSFMPAVKGPITFVYNEESETNFKIEILSDARDQVRYPHGLVLSTWNFKKAPNRRLYIDAFDGVGYLKHFLNIDWFKTKDIGFTRNELENIIKAAYVTYKPCQ